MAAWLRCPLEVRRIAASAVDRPLAAAPLLHFVLCSAVGICVLISGACSQRPSAAAVNRAVAERFNSEITIETLVVSRTSSKEAQAKTRIGNGVFDLRFRREGWSTWRWESARVDETRWLSAEPFVAHVHEQARQERIRHWVRTVVADYTATIRGIDEYSDFLPAAADSPFTKAEWTRKRREMAGTLRHAVRILNFSSEEQRRQLLAADLLEHASTDAWKEAVAVTFDAPRRQALFLSSGPDRVKGSADDVACTVTGTLARDPAAGAMRWTYRKQWRVPEGLEPALNDGVARAPNRHATFTRLVD